MAKFLSFANKTKIAAAAASGGDKRGKQYLDPWIPGTAGIAKSTVEISISCRNLADKDYLSKSDPMAVVLHRPPGSRSWVQMMRTEIVSDDLNPDFVAKVVMDYRFEQVQALRFEVYDVDSATAKLGRHDSLGYLETSLGQIVSAGEEGMTVELQTHNAPVMGANGMPTNRDPSTIILIAEELASEKEEIAVKFAGHSIGTWSGCLPPRTYYAVSKINDAGKYLIVHRSKMARGSYPTWPPMKISSRSLCNGDFDRELKVEIFQRKFSGALTSVGSMLTTVNKMSKAGNDKQDMLTPTGQASKSHLRIVSCTITPISTFVDYIQNGTQIQCCFAIDFTCSNGDPEDSQSLHYLSNSSNHPNAYEQAITAVGNILKDYDNAGLYPAWGFGARIPPKGEISHNFPLTLSRSPNCTSIPGVLESYRACIGKIMLYGPTNFAPVINTVATMASKTKTGQSYYILVIITDGVISDMAKTKKAVVEASAYPMSIIIIGIGEGEFDGMEELDGDAVLVTYKRKKAQRDIVQFVAYRSARAWMASTGESTLQEINFQQQEDYSACLEAASTPAVPPSVIDDDDDDPVKEPTPVKIQVGGHEDRQDKTNRLAQSQLAQEVLAEIPEQITGYMKAKGILPNMVKKDVKPAVMEEAAAAV